MNLRSIEEAAINAWPALRQQLYDGWILRFSEGYTKRANSVNPLYSSNLELAEKIDYCERAYRAMGLPPIFRLSEPFAPAQLDTELALRDYQKLDPTLVMSLDLSIIKSAAGSKNVIREQTLSHWLNLFTQFSGYDPQKQPIHEKILGLIVSPCLTVTLQTPDEVVSLGLGVLQGKMFGLFDIITHPDHRNKGYGRELVQLMLQWAKEQGVQHAYLQVMEQNSPARHLYTQLGFDDLYGYWYRVSI
jgi:N-acetylglutamate synthase